MEFGNRRDFASVSCTHSWLSIRIERWSSVSRPEIIYLISIIANAIVLLIFAGLSGLGLYVDAVARGLFAVAHSHAGTVNALDRILTLMETSAASSKPSLLQNVEIVKTVGENPSADTVLADKSNLEKLFQLVSKAFSA